MKPSSFLPRLLAIAAAVAPASLHASGGFYEEPLTTLPDFLKLDSLPAKTFQAILAETAPPVPDAEAVHVEKEIAAFKLLPGPQVLVRLDQLLIRARGTKDFEALKLLNDLRDLYAGPASAAETDAYIAWRTGNLAYDPEDLDARLKNASPALRPHYLYLRGALLFLEDRDADSQIWFERVLREFPKHPRAEIALYMAARSQLSRSRSRYYTQNDRQLIPAQRPRARQLLEQYLAKYPKGRWAGDALGWLAAWHYDGDDFAAALRCYLEQLNLPDHPELAASAAIMCEKTLSHLASAPREKAWADVAKYPQAAQALVYLLLNSSESDNYNGQFDSAEEVRGWRKKLLPQVAAAIASQDKLYKDAAWRPRYLATLALAASGAGQQEQALKLLATAGADAETDDLLLARGVVFQRAKRSKDAIPVLRTLLEKFPESPLIRGARLQLGMALADDRQAGQAILELDPLLTRPAADAAEVAEDADDFDPSSYPIYSLIADEQVRQLIDLWLNFAPVEELTAPALVPGFDAVQRLRFTEPVAQRLLAKEQFEEAKKYLTPAQFGLVAGPLETLTKAAREATEPAARAAACLALGDAWAAARGKLLTYPLDTDKTRREVYPYEDAYANVRRAEAAAVLGYTGNFRLDLENRDELRHAFNWWLEASDAQPGTATTATALWRALRAMPLIADVSPFTEERARARQWEGVSRKLYDRLRQEIPDSAEARRCAVTWTFPAPKKRPPDEDYGRQDRDAAGAKLPVLEVFGLEQEYPANGPEIDALSEQVEELASDARHANLEVVKARVEKLRAKARQQFSGLFDARWVNFFDDLALFFAEPDPGAEVRGRYVQLRVRFLNNSAIGGHGYGEDPDKAPDPDAALQKDIQAALADAQTKPVADYFEFLNLAVIANHFTFVKLNAKPKDQDADILEKGDGDTYRTRDYPLLAKKTQAFLDKHPRSKKREAALLLHARAVYRSSVEMTVRNYVTWPQGARWEGGYVSTVSAQEPFDAKRIQATLDAYERAFPRGRYASDIRDYRAEVALRLQDWKAALELTIAQLHDPSREDLHSAAALRLAEIFRQLGDERYRADLLPAIKAHPRGRELLGKYLAFESDIHPLRYLGAWLREQLAKR
jgi:outer membrane protein assembly factor BamD (BamD/ComL family)